MSGQRATTPGPIRWGRSAGPPPAGSSPGPRTGAVWRDIYDDPACWSRENPAAACLPRWITDYLVHPHPDLGRDGPVCPFVRQTTVRHALWTAVIPGGDALTVEEISDAVRDAHDLYGRLCRNGPEARWAASVTVFPGLTHYDRIDTVHRRHKTEVVRAGSMLGQFYPGCRVPGLWNADFRPLDAPLPMLVIRPMMSTDYPFLVARTDWLYAYLGKVAPHLPRALRWSIAERMRVPETEAEKITALRVHARDEHAR